MGLNGPAWPWKTLPLGKAGAMFGERLDDQRCVLARKFRRRDQPVVAEAIERSKGSGAEGLEAVAPIAQTSQVLLAKQHELDLI